MKIDSFNIEQQAMSKYQRVEKEVVNIQIQQFSVEDALDISEEGLSLVEDKDEFEDYLTDEDKRKIELLESFISWLTGKKFKFSQIAADKKSKGNQGPQFAMRIHTSHEVYEKESMKFSSKGVVKTEDGKTIDFEYNMMMSREKYEKNEAMLQVGNFHDPLVLNFNGQGIDFGGKKIKIDLDLDGTVDEFNFLSQGSGFLALDNNNNGIIDDGTELFGPQTNSGFGELRTFDLDNNSWIDENDDIFGSLKIWTVGDDGEQKLIGDSDMAKISGSSIYLKESGEANVIHEVDIKI